MYFFVIHATDLKIKKKIFFYCYTSQIGFLRTLIVLNFYG